MARKHEAEVLLRAGHHPSAIATAMGISVKSVIQYLSTRVGEGGLLQSELYFSWSPELRAVLQEEGEAPTTQTHGCLARSSRSPTFTAASSATRRPV